MTLRELLPTHEVHFQVLDAAGNVRVNDTLHAPLLRIVDHIEERFAARNEEREIQVGLVRVPVPDYDLRAFREAVNNALLHRDYTRLDAVYIQIYPDRLLITSPGGFPAGVGIDNILVHEPKPRNPRLAEACKRIGLVERTGRGVDTIYLGQVRYGRQAPNYGRSDGTGVRVRLEGGDAPLAFAAFAYEEDRLGRALSLEELLALTTLLHERRVDTAQIAHIIQQDPRYSRAVLERLHERGLVIGRGERRDRVYLLSASLYRRFGMEAEYIRATGFEPYQQEQMVLSYVRKHGRVTRSQVAELCRITDRQARSLLQRLTTTPSRVSARRYAPRCSLYLGRSTAQMACLWTSP